MRAKAAATRRLAQFALEVVVEHGTGSGDDRLMHALCQLLCNKFYDIIEHGSHFLTGEARREMPKLGNRFGDLYQQLADNSFRAGVKLWKMSPKLHLFMHLTAVQCVLYGTPGTIGRMQMKTLSE